MQSPEEAFRGLPVFDIDGGAHQAVAYSKAAAAALGLEQREFQEEPPISDYYGALALVSCIPPALRTSTLMALRSKHDFATNMQGRLLACKAGLRLTNGTGCLPTYLCPTEMIRPAWRFTKNPRQPRPLGGKEQHSDWQLQLPQTSFAECFGP